MTLSFGSLFAGIGGFDLGFERAGMVCKWQVEIDEFCRKVLAKHWPMVRRHDDVQTFPPAPAEEWQVDVIAGGFPCQDISSAGRKAGIKGTKSGLWKDYARIIDVLRPSWVVIENVATLLNRGLDTVLGDLHSLGFDAEWHCIPARYVGAPIDRQGRDRIWIVANADRRGRVREGVSRLEGEGQSVAGSAGGGGGFLGISLPTSSNWPTEPDVGRVADGVSNRVDRIRALGNAVVPVMAELIGRRLVAIAQNNLVE